MCPCTVMLMESTGSLGLLPLYPGYEDKTLQMTFSNVFFSNESMAYFDWNYTLDCS